MLECPFNKVAGLQAKYFEKHLWTAASKMLSDLAFQIILGIYDKKNGLHPKL